MKGSAEPIPFFRGKLLLYQPKEHRVSVDLVVFLSKLRGVKHSSKVADLGAGFGFLSLSIAKKFRCKVKALERDGEMFSLLVKNVELNSLEKFVEPVLVDIREVHRLFQRGEFDAVVLNPPFFPESYGIGDGNKHFEGDTTLEHFLQGGAYILRDGGYLNVLLPSFRLAESLYLMKELNLPPRFLSVIYPTPYKEGKLCVVSCIKNVPGPLKVDRATFINDEEGKYTREVEELLERYI